MGKEDWKAKAKALKKKLKALRDELSGVGAKAVANPAKAAKPVSPLAPTSFPTLPVIKGAEFAAIGAGIKYQNRKDVMLVRLAPGTSVAGVFTRSSTRSRAVSISTGTSELFLSSLSTANPSIPGIITSRITAS